MEHGRTNDTVWMALALIAVGVILLVGIGNLLLTVMFGLLLFLPGVGLWYAYRMGHKATAPLAIPALIIGGTGAILMFQSLTGYWDSWAYAWTLYSVFFGYGLVLMGQRLEEPSLVQIGRVFTVIGGISFVSLGSLYILLTTPFLRYILAFAAFVAGGYLIWKRQEDNGLALANKSKRKISHESIRINLDDSEAA